VQKRDKKQRVKIFASLEFDFFRVQLKFAFRKSTAVDVAILKFK